MAIPHHHHRRRRRRRHHHNCPFFERRAPSPLPARSPCPVQGTAGSGADRRCGAPPGPGGRFRGPGLGKRPHACLRAGPALSRACALLACAGPLSPTAPSGQRWSGRIPCPSARVKKAKTRYGLGKKSVTTYNGNLTFSRGFNVGLTSKARTTKSFSFFVIRGFHGSFGLIGLYRGLGLTGL